MHVCCFVAPDACAMLKIFRFYWFRYFIRLLLMLFRFDIIYCLSPLLRLLLRATLAATLFAIDVAIACFSLLLVTILRRFLRFDSLFRFITRRLPLYAPAICLRWYLIPAICWCRFCLFFYAHADISRHCCRYTRYASWCCFDAICRHTMSLCWCYCVHYACWYYCRALFCLLLFFADAVTARSFMLLFTPFFCWCSPLFILCHFFFFFSAFDIDLIFSPFADGACAMILSSPAHSDVTMLIRSLLLLIFHDAMPFFMLYAWCHFVALLPAPCHTIFAAVWSFHLFDIDSFFFFDTLATLLPLMRLFRLMPCLAFAVILSAVLPMLMLAPWALFHAAMRMTPPPLLSMFMFFCLLFDFSILPLFLSFSYWYCLCFASMVYAMPRAIATRWFRYAAIDMPIWYFFSCFPDDAILPMFHIDAAILLFYFARAGMPIAPCLILLLWCCWLPLFFRCKRLLFWRDSPGFSMPYAAMRFLILFFRYFIIAILLLFAMLFIIAPFACYSLVYALSLRWWALFSCHIMLICDKIIWCWCRHTAARPYSRYYFAADFVAIFYYAARVMPPFTLMLMLTRHMFSSSAYFSAILRAITFHYYADVLRRSLIRWYAFMLVTYVVPVYIRYIAVFFDVVIITFSVWLSLWRYCFHTYFAGVDIHARRHMMLRLLLFSMPALLCLRYFHFRYHVFELAALSPYAHCSFWCSLLLMLLLRLSWYCRHDACPSRWLCLHAADAFSCRVFHFRLRADSIIFFFLMLTPFTDARWCPRPCCYLALPPLRDYIRHDELMLPPFCLRWRYRLLPIYLITIILMPLLFCATPLPYWCHLLFYLPPDADAIIYLHYAVLPYERRWVRLPFSVAAYTRRRAFHLHTMLLMPCYIIISCAPIMICWYSYCCLLMARLIRRDARDAAAMLIITIRHIICAALFYAPDARFVVYMPYGAMLLDLLMLYALISPILARRYFDMRLWWRLRMIMRYFAFMLIAATPFDERSLMSPALCSYAIRFTADALPAAAILLLFLFFSEFLLLPFIDMTPSWCCLSFFDSAMPAHAICLYAILLFRHAAVLRYYRRVYSMILLLLLSCYLILCMLRFRLRLLRVCWYRHVVICLPLSPHLCCWCYAIDAATFAVIFWYYFTRVSPRPCWCFIMFIDTPSCRALWCSAICLLCWYAACYAHAAGAWCLPADAVCRLRHYWFDDWAPYDIIDFAPCAIFSIIPPYFTTPHAW